MAQLCNYFLLAAAYLAPLLQSGSSTSSGYSNSGSPSDKQKVIELLKSLETGDTKPLSYLNATNFIQHNLALGPGVSGFRAFISALNGTGATINTVRIFQEGNFVFAHSVSSVFGAFVSFDVFRFEGGLIVEHWDNSQANTGPNPSGHTMTDGPTQATDLDKTEQNKALIKDFFDTVFIGGNFSQLQHYFNGNIEIQHNPSIADGLDGLAAGLAAFAAAGRAISYTKVHQIHGEGNFVLVMSEGLLGSQPTGYYDLFRIENGKVAEHWDVIQAIPPQSEWKNPNGKW
ncbi:hypothetical protein BV898_10209 [Hypsibius exemplaris]|uniref:SnoaL-like domain-containing protein n=1 Tax=Hypsibius exemplaris TaxID=2072580 RepID=A0A1W0WK79_HYPEX|nr:hypothetical protein BV898_10209 [Hypsibius exemplaris]